LLLVVFSGSKCAKITFAARLRLGAYSGFNKKKNTGVRTAVERKEEREG